MSARIANGFSWNSPGHAQFTEMAENFEKRATELEFQFIASPQVSEARQQLEQSQGQQGPSIMGFEDKVEQSLPRPCCWQVQADIRTHPHPSSREGHHSTAGWSSTLRRTVR